jgi:hypothetical protein
MVYVVAIVPSALTRFKAGLVGGRFSGLGGRFGPVESVLFFLIVDNISATSGDAASTITACLGVAMRFGPVDAVVLMRTVKSLLMPHLLVKHSVSLAAAIGDFLLRPEILVP